VQHREGLEAELLRARLELGVDDLRRLAASKMLRAVGAVGQCGSSGGDGDGGGQRGSDERVGELHGLPSIGPYRIVLHGTRT